MSTNEAVEIVEIVSEEPSDPQGERPSRRPSTRVMRCDCLLII